MSARPVLPTGYLDRPPRLDDIPEVVTLQNGVHLREIGAQFVDVRGLRRDWTVPRWDLHENARIVAASDGAIAAVISVYPADPPRRISLDGYVDPRHQGHGIGTWLLTWGLDRAGQIAKASGQPDALAVHGAWNASGPAHDVLRTRGFEATRRFDDLDLVLDAPPAKPRAIPGVHIRILRPGADDRQVWEAEEEAFADHFGHAPVAYEHWRHDMIDANPQFDPALWFVAVADGAIVGICAATTGLPEDPAIGWIETLAVRRAWRRQGIGTALLLAAMHAFYKRGTRRVGLAVDSESLTGAHRLYERLGMRPYRSWIQYQLALRTTPTRTPRDSP